LLHAHFILFINIINYNDYFSKEWNLNV